jgi:hypothetical protein
MKKERRVIEVAGVVTRKHIDPYNGNTCLLVCHMRFSVSGYLFNRVREGEEVVITLDTLDTKEDIVQYLAGDKPYGLCINYPVVNIEHGTLSTAQQLATLELQAAHRRAEVCAQQLRDLEIPARSLERDPMSAQGNVWIPEDVGPTPWIAIAEGPIPWVQEVTGGGGLRVHDRGYDGYICHVPDSRIRPDSLIALIRSVHVKSFPLFGRVKGVRWKYNPRHDQPYWNQFHDYHYSRPFKAFNLLVARYLTADAALEARMLSASRDIFVRMNPGQGCWVLFINTHKGFDRPLWDCCGMVAQHLLATPIPIGE